MCDSQEAQNEFEEATREDLRVMMDREYANIKLDLIDDQRQFLLAYRTEHGRFPNVEEFSELYESFKTAAEETAKPPLDKNSSPKEKSKSAGTNSTKAPPNLNQPSKTGEKNCLEELFKLSQEFESTWRPRIATLDERHDKTRNTLLPMIELRAQEEVKKKILVELENLIAVFDKPKTTAKASTTKKSAKSTLPCTTPPVERTEEAKDEIIVLKVIGLREATMDDSVDNNTGKTAEIGKNSKVPKYSAAQGLLGDTDDLLPDLVNDGILKKIKPAKMSDFILEYEKRNDMISSFEVKQQLLENCILPLGCDFLKKNSPFAARSLLLFGPHGTGKSLLARVIATETGSAFFDISHAVTASLYNEDKLGPAMLVHKTFLVAQECAPSVIYVDKVEEVFATLPKQKKSQTVVADPESTPMAAQVHPSRIKKELIAHVNRIINCGPDSLPLDRVLIIGCTTNPFGNPVEAELLNFFDEKIYLGLPNSSTRISMLEVVDSLQIVI
eukprot:GHVL01001879.1.p1 GENE.GHVL01001879.1~~GHVL01001879.1.p1  ORF type:complete len:500 (-),score=91.15 GHVL01001879.1:5410-6909(-)